MAFSIFPTIIIIEDLIHVEMDNIHDTLIPIAKGIAICGSSVKVAMSLPDLSL